MRFLFLEPFYGGSHREFADGLIAHSSHRIDLVTLPARFWKWRMRGAALHFIENIPALDRYDGLILSDLMSLSDFKALAGDACPPAFVYFHENQLTYPLAPGESQDYQFGFTDITTALNAQRIAFNSHTHANAFLEAVPAFMKMMPEYRPDWVTANIRAKTRVLYPGCSFASQTERLPPPDLDPPLIIWNHRWEFDKNPHDFFDALDAALARGLEFRLALLGENFQMVPKPFISARKRYGERIVQYGYVASRRAYFRWLEQGAIVISTADQENFGLSVVEAIRHGCYPLLPNRLSYPELIPDKFHSQVLYTDQTDLVTKLTGLLNDYPSCDLARQILANEMTRFAWQNQIQHYDRLLTGLAAAKTSPP